MPWHSLSPTWKPAWPGWNNVRCLRWQTWAADGANGGAGAAARCASAASAPAALDLAPLEARIAALERSRQPTASWPVDDARSAAPTRWRPPWRGRSGAPLDARRIATAERNAGQVSTLADRLGRLGRVQAAQLALDAGQKLGDMPGAPPALTRFANAAPPTEATLRLAFPQAAREALAAARPPSEDKPLLARLWDETQDLVTVRQGDRVLVGDPAAGVLERARAALNAGDLSGAIAAVAALSGPPAQAMAPWLTEARALLDARAALAEWAAHA